MKKDKFAFTFLTDVFNATLRYMNRSFWRMRGSGNFRNVMEYVEMKSVKNSSHI
jgi:hypothetical protein